ncbi:hypothetical protein HMPREF1601_05100 [Escherichia coli 907779]|nr:hypothetical protein P423_01515 [Escherichia coli JJ1886]ESA81893.1 hypothetical protein HMPREF1601_05100 [Escherichia coli 907779]ESC92816.1 hypothetical protein HMPREF1594_04070 [Escherichia coli 907446]ESD05675.1 hypothetical protein HMPREF1596_04878 [Escherichia coli 907700]ESD14127.1 hypothetical protein HMPREF1597_05080 [Escherichia coli 907701]ESD51302.1 hypothetical protein HMPREF1607_04930 [Escherichia coli 908524]ESD95911.1 hypothetical protein HMPREF1614_03824 [Escherichia coli 
MVKRHIEKNKSLADTFGAGLSDPYEMFINVGSGQVADAY